MNVKTLSLIDEFSNMVVNIRCDLVYMSEELLIELYQRINAESIDIINALRRDIKERKEENGC